MRVIPAVQDGDGGRSRIPEGMNRLAAMANASSLRVSVERVNSLSELARVALEV
jgi:hypothetical protein